MISDIHMDYDYTPGMDTKCPKPLCCRSDSGVAPSPDRAAGKWGDFECDTTTHTLKSLFAEITDNIKPDVVFWGGDSIPHNLDSLTFDTNVAIMKNVTADVAAGLSSFKVFPTIGNHDTYPQDDIKMTTARSNPAINEWAPTWNQFIQDDEQLKTWLDYGYFSLPLTNKNGTKLGKTETRVISLNSNICYDLNFESMTAFNDPGDQLGWLETQLLELEKVNGTAIMLAHVPNLDECTRQYGRRYHALSDRFQHIIRWGMYSHIHQEQYQVVRDMVTHEPIGMNFIVGSVTTYKGKPPSFNVVYLDAETMLPIDYETHTFDLEHANKYDEPKWDLKFNYRDEYGLKDLSPSTFYNHSK